MQELCLFANSVLNLLNGGNEAGQASRVYVADREYIEVSGAEGKHMESGVICLDCARWIGARSLHYKDGDAVLADAVEQQRRRLVVKVSKIGSFKPGVGGQVFREIETERNLALKPWLHGVPVGRNHLRRRVGGKRGDVLVARLGYERSGFGRERCFLMRIALEDKNAATSQQQCCCDGPSGNRQCARRVPRSAHGG